MAAAVSAGGSTWQPLHSPLNTHADAAPALAGGWLRHAQSPSPVNVIPLDSHLHRLPPSTVSAAAATADVASFLAAVAAASPTASASHASMPPLLSAALSPQPATTMYSSAALPGAAAAVSPSAQAEPPAAALAPPEQGTSFVDWYQAHHRALMASLQAAADVGSLVADVSQLWSGNGSVADAAGGAAGPGGWADSSQLWAAPSRLTAAALDSSLVSLTAAGVPNGDAAPHSAEGGRDMTARRSRRQATARPRSRSRERAAVAAASEAATPVRPAGSTSGTPGFAAPTASSASRARPRLPRRERAAPRPRSAAPSPARAAGRAEESRDEALARTPVRRRARSASPARPQQAAAAGSTAGNGRGAAGSATQPQRARRGSRGRERPRSSQRAEPARRSADAQATAAAVAPAGASPPVPALPSSPTPAPALDVLNSVTWPAATAWQPLPEHAASHAAPPLAAADEQSVGAAREEDAETAWRNAYTRLLRRWDEREQLAREQLEQQREAYVRASRPSCPCVTPPRAARRRMALQLQQVRAEMQAVLAEAKMTHQAELAVSPCMCKHVLSSPALVALLLPAATALMPRRQPRQRLREQQRQTDEANAQALQQLRERHRQQVRWSPRPAHLSARHRAPPSAGGVAAAAAAGGERTRAAAVQPAARLQPGEVRAPACLRKRTAAHSARAGWRERAVRGRRRTRRWRRRSACAGSWRASWRRALRRRQRRRRRSGSWQSRRLHCTTRAPLRMRLLWCAAVGPCVRARLLALMPRVYRDSGRRRARPGCSECACACHWCAARPGADDCCAQAEAELARLRKEVEIQRGEASLLEQENGRLQSENIRVCARVHAARVTRRAGLRPACALSVTFTAAVTRPTVQHSVAHGWRAVRQTAQARAARTQACAWRGCGGARGICLRRNAAQPSSAAHLSVAAECACWQSVCAA